MAIQSAGLLRVAFPGGLECAVVGRWAETSIIVFQHRNTGPSDWAKFGLGLKLVIQATADKIRSFGNLPAGWHYGSGVPAPAIVVDLALKVEDMLRASGYPETDAFPGCDGEIAVTGYLDGCSVNVEVRDEGRYCPPRSEFNV